MFGWFKSPAPAPAAPVAPPADAAVTAQAHRDEGNRFLDQDQFEAAAACYAQAVAVHPGDVKALVNLGFCHSELGHAAQAIEALGRALLLDPANHDALYLLAGAQEQSGDLAGATQSLEKVTQLQPAFELAWRDLGRLLVQTARIDAARAVLDAGIRAHPGFADLHFFSGHLWLQTGQPEPAVASYRAALACNPGNPDVAHALASALSDLGHVLRQQGRLPSSRDSCREAIAVDPDLAGAHNNLGATLVEMHELAPALASFERAIALAPEFAGAHTNRGALLAALGRPQEALESHAAALRFDPNSAEAHNNLGNTLLELHRPEHALASFEQALMIDPRHPRALNHRGNALRQLGRKPQALASYDAAIAALPAYAEAWNNRGNVLADLERLQEADAAYTQALAINGDYAEALFNQGNVLRNAGRIEQALANYWKALALKPDMPFLYGNWLHAKMHLCDWSGLDAQFAELARRMEAGQLVNPFVAIPTDLPAQLQRIAVENFVRGQFPGPVATLPLPTASDASAGRRIRIGYFSADFHEHATAYLMAELFERHDHKRFELFAFSFGPVSPSAMRSRLEAAFDHFLVVNPLTDAQIAAEAHERGIDIAVDLKGFTQNSRPGIFAVRAAPVQVNYLGFPGTMGAPFIDYLIADNTVVPPAHRDLYSEKIASLPHSYQVNDSQRAIDAHAPTRRELGLPEDGFVFCCFNGNYKITPATFDVWMRLLQEVPGSVLWLLHSHAVSAANLRAEAVARGISADRLVFAPKMPLSAHLARHSAADLFLDTFFCNAHTTASDALWAGLPVLTLEGDTFAGRVAASLLNAVDLGSLVTHSVHAYEAKALALARDGEALQSLKGQLQRNRLVKPLFNAGLFARHLEAAFSQMHATHSAGSAPGHFSVPA